MQAQRREFLRHIAAGSAILAMPAILQGCGVTPSKIIAEPMPEDPFMDWFQIDREIVTKVMSALTVRGADQAELYFQHRRKSALRMQDGAIDRSSVDILQGVGMRVTLGEASGFAFTEDLSLEGMLATARRAVSSISGETVIFESQFVAKPAGDCYTTNISWADIEFDRKLPVLQRVDQLARRSDPAVDNVAVSWSDTDERVLIATHDGNLIYDHRPLTRLSAQVSVTRDKDSHSGFANISARDEIAWYTDKRVDSMTREAVDRGLALFDSRRPPLGEMPVVLSAGTSGVILHEAIGHALEADFIRDGKSVYASRMNTAIADSSVTIVDNGRLPHERGALNYDDEGNQCGQTTLVENGMLRAFLHDGSSARAFGVAVTGSGRRESFQHRPMPRMTCTTMQNGPYDREELIKGMDRGIIAETYIDGRVDLGAGDYTFYVKSGWLVEKGRVLMPVRDFQLVGNGPDTLRNITMVANDSIFDTGGWTCGKNGQTVPVSQGMPSVLVSRLGVQAA